MKLGIRARRAIQFNRTDYPASTRVVSELDLHYFRLGWIWQLPVIPGKLRAGPLLGRRGSWSKGFELRQAPTLRPVRGSDPQVL